MRLGTSTKWVVMLAMLVCAVEGMAAEASVSLDVASAYVFRGATFNNGLVAQPGLEVSGLPVTVGVWGNFDIDDNDGTLEGSEFSEIDLYASYDLPLPEDSIFGVSIGYCEYLYPGFGDVKLTAEGTNVSAEATQGVADREVSLSLSLDVPLAPSVAVYYGLGGGLEDSLYAEAGIGYEFTLGEDVGVELGATVWYADVDGGESGFSHYTASVGASYGWVGASVTYIGQIDDAVLGDAYDVDVVGMLSVSHDF